jgi:hypothetical protein
MFALPEELMSYSDVFSTVPSAAKQTARQEPPMINYECLKTYLIPVSSFANI